MKINNYGKMIITIFKTPNNQLHHPHKEIRIIENTFTPTHLVSIGRYFEINGKNSTTTT